GVGVDAGRGGVGGGGCDVGRLVGHAAWPQFQRQRYRRYRDKSWMALDGRRRHLVAVGGERGLAVVRYASRISSVAAALGGCRWPGAAARRCRGTAMGLVAAVP